VLPWSLINQFTPAQIAYGAGTAILKMKHGSSEELDRATIDIIKKAIRAGYRHLDTADIYNNTAEVGVAIRESFAEGVIKKREELYITTKVAENFANIAEQLEKGLQLLGVDYVDLYVHS
jgi:diketogulonate reductase-like aldo/keto reductase